MPRQRFGPWPVLKLKTMSRRSFWFVFALAMALLPGLALAQKVTPIRKSGADFKTIVRLVTPKFRSASGVPVRFPAEKVRRYNDWCLFVSSIKEVRTGKTGDDTAAAVLQKVHGKWKIVDWDLGETDDTIGRWLKKYHLPATMVK